MTTNATEPKAFVRYVQAREREAKATALRRRGASTASMDVEWVTVSQVYCHSQLGVMQGRRRSITASVPGHLVHYART